MKIAFDTETTGLDVFFGAKPYLITICADGKDPVYWEWSVNPLTRTPQVDRDDLDQILDYVDSAEEIVGHNVRFDVHAMTALEPSLQWPWHKTRDTTFAAHLLHSAAEKSLDSLVLMHLNIDIEPFEKEVERLTRQARSDVRTKLIKNGLPWRIAQHDMDDMPSVKKSSKGKEDRVWKADMWLLRALCDYADSMPRWEPPVYTDRRKRKAPEPPWYYAYRDKPELRRAVAVYACGDSKSTYHLAEEMESRVRKEGLWELYLDRHKLLRPTYDMERYGATTGLDKQELIGEKFRREAEDAEAECRSVASSFGVTLPSLRGKALSEFVFETMRLDVVGRTDSGAPSFDKEARTKYALTLSKGSPPWRFVKNYGHMQSRQTGLSYIDGYRRFGVADPRHPRHLQIHSVFNPTGSNTLRWTNRSPNTQNVSKKTDDCFHCDGTGTSLGGEKCRFCDGTGEESLSLRACFSWLPWEEGWSFDFENIELRIPAYESGEEAMIALFEKANEPPYFGSYHLLNASVIYPEEFWPLADKKGAFKEKYKPTLYQWVKNFGFAIQYQCGEATADRAAHKVGAYRLLKQNLPKLAALNDRYVAEAMRTGYVHTIRRRGFPRGYPVMCSRSSNGFVSPTVPLSYHVQSTAMECTCTSMWMIHDYLKQFNTARSVARLGRAPYRQCLQVHDENVIVMPKGTGPEPWRENLTKALRIRQIMESVGDDIGVPLRVSMGYHPDNWGEEVKVDAEK